MHEYHFMTERLVNYIRSEALHRTFTSVAKDTGLVEGTIRLLFAEFTINVEPHFPYTNAVVVHQADSRADSSVGEGLDRHGRFLLATGTLADMNL